MLIYFMIYEVDLTATATKLNSPTSMDPALLVWNVVPRHEFPVNHISTQHSFLVQVPGCFSDLPVNPLAFKWLVPIHIKYLEA